MESFSSEGSGSSSGWRVMLGMTVAFNDNAITPDPTFLYCSRILGHTNPWNGAFGLFPISQAFGYSTRLDSGSFKSRTWYYNFWWPSHSMLDFWKMDAKFPLLLSYWRLGIGAICRCKVAELFCLLIITGLVEAAYSQLKPSINYMVHKVESGR
jgi:hypothetical protein